MEQITHKIGNSSVTVLSGDMTKITADAYAVPQFTQGMSDGGVGEAILKEAKTGMQAYQNHVKANGEQRLGSVLLVDAGGGRSKKLLHLTTMVDGKLSSFDTFHDSLYNALHAAKDSGIKDLVVPALGTGVRRDLTHEQSAMLMNAIHKYEQNGGTPLNITFPIFNNPELHKVYSNTLQTKRYADEAALIAAKAGKVLEKSNGKKWAIGLAATAAVVGGVGWLMHSKNKKEAAEQNQTTKR